MGAGDFKSICLIKFISDIKILSISADKNCFLADITSCVLRNCKYAITLLSSPNSGQTSVKI